MKTLPEVSREAGLDCIYRALLARCPLRWQRDVVAYLDGRGIFADAEGVGVAALPPVPAQATLARALVEAFPRAALVAAGVIREERDLLEWPAHRLMIPWRDRTGRISSLQRRVLDHRATATKYVFPRGCPPREPFGAEFFDARTAVGDDVAVIVTEGAIEALARRKLARVWGEQAAVLAVPSASTLLRASVWKRFLEGRDVVIAFDSDEAGNEAAERFAAQMCAGARTVVRERLVGAKDFGEAIHAKEIVR